MAVVYRGLDTVMRREVAIKLVRTSVDNRACGDRFRADGELLARLNHPGRVTVYDAGVHDGRPTW